MKSRTIFASYVICTLSVVCVVSDIYLVSVIYLVNVVCAAFPCAPRHMEERCTRRVLHNGTPFITMIPFRNRTAIYTTCR